MRDEAMDEVRPDLHAATRQWVCKVCGWIYDEAEGLPEHGIAAGSRLEDLPDDWHCPDCGVGKADFELLEF